MPPPQLNPSEAPVPDPSGKVLAKFRGKVLAKLSTKTPGKATRQLVLGRAVKLPGVRKSTVRCGHSLVTQGILPAAKLYYGSSQLGACDRELELWCKPAEGRGGGSSSGSVAVEAAFFELSPGVW